MSGHVYKLPPNRWEYCGDAPGPVRSTCIYDGLLIVILKDGRMFCSPREKRPLEWQEIPFGVVKAEEGFYDQAGNWVKQDVC